jgi:hypothetical protein
VRAQDAQAAGDAEQLDRLAARQTKRIETVSGSDIT